MNVLSCVQRAGGWGWLIPAPLLQVERKGRKLRREGGLVGRKGNREVGKNGTESPVLSACHAPGTGLDAEPVALLLPHLPMRGPVSSSPTNKELKEVEIQAATKQDLHTGPSDPLHIITTLTSPKPRWPLWGQRNSSPFSKNTKY